jgi:adenylate cyclase, class 2
MSIQIIEFKARVNNLQVYVDKLLAQEPRFVGLDHQIDTYFNCDNGRLKLREGNIENALIYYNRPNAASSKLSDVKLYKHPASPELKALLVAMHGVKVVVDKHRKIYFIDNIKFHFDVVEGLGTFIEVEAIDTDRSRDIATLQSQCDHFAHFFDIHADQYVSHSYSDLLLAKLTTNA